MTKEKIEPILECARCKAETSFRLVLVNEKEGTPELFRLMYCCFNCNMWDTIVWQREPVEEVGY